MPDLPRPQAADRLPDPQVAATTLRDLRARVLAGDDIPPEEYALVIAGIRASRLAAAQADLRRPVRKTKPTTTVSLDDLLKA